MLFFNLLPADVQIVILQTWVGTELSSLSALDVAFCSRSRRPEFLTWMTHACHRWELTVSGGGKLSLSACVTWLAARNLVPAGLEISCPPHPLPAPNIEIEFKDWLVTTIRYGNIAIQEAHDVLHGCANVTTVRYTHYYLGEGAPSPAVDDASFFTGLASAPLVNLQNLFIDTDILLPMELVAAALQAVGPRLRELSLIVRTDTISRLFDLIAEHCKVLKHFAYDEPFAVEAAPISEALREALLQLVSAIPSLTSLNLGFSFTVQVHTFFPVLQQLHSLQLHCKGSFKEFVGLLEQYPSLSTLHFAEQVVCRKDRSLKLFELLDLSGSHMDLSDWFRVLSVCPGIRELVFDMALVRGNATAIMTRIGVAYGETLSLLELRFVTPGDIPSIERLLFFCSALTSLKVAGDEAICRPQILRIVGSNCKVLKSFLVCGNVHLNNNIVAKSTLPLISDADMEELCINGPKLTELVITGFTNISSLTLDTFLRLKMRFNSLELTSRTLTISKDDMLSYRRLARQQNLLLWVPPAVKFIRVAFEVSE